jgi:transposase
MLHIEVRKKILKARKKGVRVAEICRAYSIGKTAVYDLLKLERETGKIEPRTYLRGRKPTLCQAELDAIENLLKTRKDITIAEIRDELGLSLCDSSIGGIVRNKLGYRYKKRQYMPPNGTDRTL